MTECRVMTDEDMARIYGSPATYDKQARENAWIETYSGKQFFPFAPRPGSIVLEDIAHGLSLTVRYNRQCQRFYSVAEHSILVASFSPMHLQKEALLHDAAEAYLPDIPAPIKPHLPECVAVEALVEEAIGWRFGINLLPMHPAVKVIDRRMGVTERPQIMLKTPWPWSRDYEDLEPLPGVTLACWDPETAEFQFMKYARSLGLK